MLEEVRGGSKGDCFVPCSKRVGAISKLIVVNVGLGFSHITAGDFDAIEPCDEAVIVVDGENEWVGLASICAGDGEVLSTVKRWREAPEGRS